MSTLPLPIINNIIQIYLYTRKIVTFSLFFTQTKCDLPSYFYTYILE